MGLLGSIIGAGADLLSTKWNIKQQRDLLAYQKETQQKAWGREDTAIQRRAADMKAAGLSQTLAAGSGASTMAPIRLEAPQIPEKAGSSAIQSAIGIRSGALNLMQQKKNIAITDQQKEINRLELAKRKHSVNEQFNTWKEHVWQEKYKTSQELTKAQEARYNFEYFKNKSQSSRFAPNKWVQLANIVLDAVRGQRGKLESFNPYERKRQKRR